MNMRGFLIITLIVVSVGIACLGLGWWAGRTGTQRVTGLEYSPVLGTPVILRDGRRIRLYLSPEIQGEPAFTIMVGRVSRGDQLEKPFLTLEDKRVYSGGGTDGPLLYRFDGNQVIEAHNDGPTQFVQRDNKIYFGPDPQAPVLFTFEGTRVYRGDARNGRIFVTSNTVFNDSDLVKLVTIVLYMETLE